MVQMPYIYYSYVDSGCTQNDIGQIKVPYNLSTAALSILVGPILSFLGHHKLLMTQFALLFGTLFTFFLCNLFSDSVIHVLPVSYFLGSITHSNAKSYV